MKHSVKNQIIEKVKRASKNNYSLIPRNYLPRHPKTLSFQTTLPSLNPLFHQRISQTPLLIIRWKSANLSILSSAEIVTHNRSSKLMSYYHWKRVWKRAKINIF